MSWSFTIPVTTPSLNDILGCHRMVCARAKTVLDWRVQSALNAIPKIPAATGRRRLLIVRHGWNKLDRANLVGGVKWLEDCLVRRRLLIDDREQYCDLVVEQVIERRREPFTVVFLEDIEVVA